MSATRELPTTAEELMGARVCEQIARQAARRQALRHRYVSWREITTRFRGTCVECRQRIHVGEPALYDQGAVVHPACGGYDIRIVPEWLT